MANPILDSDLEQVLNLHRGIADRWSGPGSLNGATAGLDSAFFGTDRMLAALPGLAAVNGSFGADAWDLANFLTVEGRFGRTLSAEVRAMSVGDLADIVQLILEEEEFAQVEQSLQTARRRAKAQGKAAPKAGRPAQRKAAPGLRRKIEAVRRSLAQVRARVAQENARQQAAPAAPDATDGGFEAPSLLATGDSVSEMAGQVGTEGPVVLGLAETLRTFARTPAARRADSPISGSTRMALRTGATWHPQATGVGVGFQATATRALRMAEHSAEMAMVEPTAELLAGSESAFAPQTRTAAPGSAPVASLAARPQLSASLFDAATGGAAVASPLTLQAARRAAPAALARETMRQAARVGAAARPLASTSPGRSPVLSPSVAAAVAPERATAPWGLQTLAAAPDFQAPSLPALSGAVRLAGQHLQRHASALAAARLVARPAQRAGPGDAPAAAVTGASAESSVAQRDLTPASAAMVGSTPIFAADRFADLLARGETVDVGTSSLLPRLTGWLEAGDQLVSSTGAPRTGYAAFDSGAGEILDLAELAEIAPAARTVQRPARPMGHAAPTTPGWLTPATARVAAQQAAATMKLAARSAAQMDVTPATAAGHAAPAPHAGHAGPTVGTTTPFAQSAPPVAWTAPRFDGATAQSAADAPMQSVATLRAAVRAMTAQSSSVAAHQPTGGAGLAAVGIAQRLAERHLGGLDPTARAPAWQPAMAPSAAAPIGMAPAALADALGEATAFASRADAPVFGLQSEWLARYDTAVPAELRGALGQDVGAGEWLLPGDDGYQEWFQQASQQPAGAPVAQPKRGVQQRALTRAAQPAPTATPSAPEMGALATRATPAARAPRAAQTPQTTQTSTPGAPTLARAAAAAIEHVVSRHERAQQTATHRPVAGARASSPLSVAGLGAAMAGGDVLGLTPGGSADAITPWLLRGALARLPAQTRRALRMAGMESGAFVDLQTETAAFDAPAPTQAVGQPGAAPTRAPSPSQAALSTAGTPAQVAAGLSSPPTVAETIHRRAERQRASLARAIERPEVRQQLRRLGSGALDVRQPAALKAALALFGEASDGPVEAEVTRSFLERWFGGHDAPARRPMKGADVSGDLVALQAERATTAGGSTLRTAGDRAMTSLAAPEAAGSDAPGGEQELVLSGLSGLNALRAMRGAGEVDTELLSTGEVRDTATPSEATAPAPGATAAVDRRSGGVRMHDFAPVALGRGRRLLGRSRRSGRSSLVRGSRAARFGGRRVGYGGAGLGGGALLGLVQGDGAGDGFHGGGFGQTRMTARAERLSEAVSARREAAGGPVGRVLRPSGRGAGRRSGGASPAAGLPRDFQFGDATPELVSPHAAMEQAAMGASAKLGGTAQSRGMKAGAMARVLSVTASPTANVLPLVAPAARALASVAAAKSLDESVVTSGSDPTAGTPIERQAGGGQQDQGEATTDEQGSELSKEINALAMRIARSVMVRIKRERERRGIHG